MSIKWEPAMDEMLITLRDLSGDTYSDIAVELTNTFGVTFSTDAVSSHYRYLKMNKIANNINALLNDEDEETDATVVQLPTKSTAVDQTTASIEDLATKLGLNRQHATRFFEGYTEHEYFKVNTKNKAEEDDGRLFPKSLYELDDEIKSVWETKTKLKMIYDLFDDGKEKKILSLSDLHAPFVDFHAVEVALKEHADATILVINGDMLDGHAMSDFDKLNDFDIDREFAQVFQLLDVASARFKYIVWNSGNHERSRFLRMVSRKFGQGMRKFAAHRLDPMNYVAEQYSNVIVAPHHWVQIGKVVFDHPNGYSNALMSTAIKQNDILKANKDNLLPSPGFQALIQGHTHDMGEYFVNGTKIIEQGCLCHRDLEYKFKNPSNRSWVIGYATAVVDGKGNVDFNNTRAYHIK